MGIAIFAKLFFQLTLPCGVQRESFVTMDHMAPGKSHTNYLEEKEGLRKAKGILRAEQAAGNSKEWSLGTYPFPPLQRALWEVLLLHICHILLLHLCRLALCT